MTDIDTADLAGIDEVVAVAENWLVRAESCGSAAFASSFGAEDMVLLDMIARRGLAIEIFTLDTGRLHEETYALMQRARERYRWDIRIYAPDAAALEGYLREYGPNAFYDGVPQRLACCAVRKVEPLRRALAGKKAWITGQRRQQAATRRQLGHREWDAANGLEKFNPLADWRTADVWAYLRSRDVPVNALHDRGFASIGCAPCTRAIVPGEDIRAGRWWWEDAAGRECGLHPAGQERG